MIKSGEFNIPEQCVGCPAIEGCLSGFAEEKLAIADEFKRFGDDLKTAQAIYYADSSAPPASPETMALLSERYAEAAKKIAVLTVETQVILNNVNKACSGYRQDGICRCPIELG